MSLCIHAEGDDVGPELLAAFGDVLPSMHRELLNNGRSPKLIDTGELRHSAGPLVLEHRPAPPAKPKRARKPRAEKRNP
jgi:hypothetical protein